MPEVCSLIWLALVGAFRSRVSLEAENTILRHQANVLRRPSPKRPTFGMLVRLLFAGLYRLAPKVLGALAIVKPENVVKWPASIEQTLALWAASLREIKKRIRPLFTQERVATNAGLFLEGLLGDEQRKTGWMRAEAAGDPGPCGSRQFWVVGIGTLMLCAISYATMSSSIWPKTMQCW